MSKRSHFLCRQGPRLHLSSRQSKRKEPIPIRERGILSITQRTIEQGLNEDDQFVKSTYQSKSQLNTFLSRRRVGEKKNVQVGQAA